MSPNVSDGHSNISREAIAEAVTREMPKGALAQGYIYSNSVELANILASYDGVSTLDLATIMYNGYLAQNDANGREYSDAYRHSTWNFRATKVLPESTVRIYTIDYEWANKLQSIWKNYYYERYNYYYSQYLELIRLGALSISDIQSLAQADADDYICEYKSSLQSSCRSDYSVFCSTFDKSNIMDWCNNVVGRYYGSNYASYSPEEMFTAAYNNNELILRTTDVAITKYSYL